MSNTNATLVATKTQNPVTEEQRRKEIEAKYDMYKRRKKAFGYISAPFRQYVGAEVDEVMRKAEVALYAERYQEAVDIISAGLQDMSRRLAPRYLDGARRSVESLEGTTEFRQLHTELAEKVTQAEIALGWVEVSETDKYFRMQNGERIKALEASIKLAREVHNRVIDATEGAKERLREQLSSAPAAASASWPGASAQRAQNRRADPSGLPPFFIQMADTVN
ncbi:MAG: hypothetical protein BWY68_00346 [bacterium ADurb.Bin400]|nr:MAG: hypothetical protein BWY68_00346 [bacterium ADurb.Bin400]